MDGRVNGPTPCPSLALAHENKTGTMRSHPRGAGAKPRHCFEPPRIAWNKEARHAGCCDQSAGDRGSGNGQVEGARRGAQPDRTPVRQGFDHAPRPGQSAGRDRDGADRVARPRHRARHRRPAARPHRRDLRAGIVRQDDARASRHRRGAEEGRRLRLHRRRARARRDLRQEARREPRRPADLAARHRRAGAGDRRHAGALGRGRHSGRRFGRGADAARRDRGRDGRPASRAFRRA